MVSNASKENVTSGIGFVYRFLGLRELHFLAITAIFKCLYRGTQLLAVILQMNKAASFWIISITFKIECNMKSGFSANIKQTLG